MKSIPSNNPRVKVQMIEREGKPFQSNVNNQNSSLEISLIKYNEIKNQNDGKNPVNDLISISTYIPRKIQSENQKKSYDYKQKLYYPK